MGPYSLLLTVITVPVRLPAGRVAGPVAVAWCATWPGERADAVVGAPELPQPASAQAAAAERKKGRPRLSIRGALRRRTRVGVCGVRAASEADQEDHRGE